MVKGEGQRIEGRSGDGVEKEKEEGEGAQGKEMKEKVNSIDSGVMLPLHFT